MSVPIYVISRANLRSNAFALSEEVMRQIKKGRNESLASVGGETVLQLDTHWSNEKWQLAGVVKYPHLKALQTHTKNLEEQGWFHAYESESLLGVVLLEKEYEIPNPLYVLWRLNVRPNIEDYTEEQVQQMKRVRDESLAKVRGKKVLQLDTRWSNEKWQFAGVVLYPSMEALRTHTRNLQEVEWYRVVETETLLGVGLMET